MTIEEAVRLALENNLGIQISRFNPQVEDLNVAQAQTAWTPSLTNTLQSTSTDSPNNKFLAGGQGLATSDDRVPQHHGRPAAAEVGRQLHRRLGRLAPDHQQLLHHLLAAAALEPVAQLDQPLLRGFSIDSIRQQVQQSLKNREIADVQVRQTVASTMRTVRNAYWNLAYAHASLRVQQQSLELAQESLRNTRSRVEIGTTPPIDIVEAESEVAQREEAVIVGEAQIQTSEDALRTLVSRPGLLPTSGPCTSRRWICRRSSRSRWTWTRRFATRSTSAPISSRRRRRLESTTSTSASCATRRCRT